MRIIPIIRVLGVGAVLWLASACITLQPRSSDPVGLRPATRCIVTVRNESARSLMVSYTIISDGGVRRGSGSLGSVGSGSSSAVPAFCGDTVIARGTADGRVAQGSAVAREAGPNEIILRLATW